MSNKTSAFYVGKDNPRFRGQDSYGYLPAIEEPAYISGDFDSPAPEIPLEPFWRKDQWAYVQQLRAQVLHLQNQVVELAARRRFLRGKY